MIPAFVVVFEVTLMCENAVKTFKLVPHSVA